MIHPTGVPRRAVRAVAAGFAVMLLMSACTGGGATGDSSARPDESHRGIVGWSDATPPGQVPASIAKAADTTGSDRLVVGGASVGQAPGETVHRPLIAVLENGGWQDVPVAANTAYGGLASIVRIAVGADGRVVGIGNVSGGAHLNPRWSAWIGSTAGVTEEPQSVETFGGPEAGGITSILSGGPGGAPGPLVVGTWSLGSGVTGIASWQHIGATWMRQPSPPVLTGSQRAQVTATAAAEGGGRVLIAGLETSFRDGRLHQQAVAWVSADAASWTRIDLDTSDQDSAATDLSCSGSGCFVVGRLGDRLAAWRVDGTGATQMTDLPDRQIDHYAAQPRIATDGPTIAIAVDARNELLLRNDAGPWTTEVTPAGETRQLVLAGGRLYLLNNADGRGVLYRRAG